MSAVSANPPPPTHMHTYTHSHTHVLTCMQATVVHLQEQLETSQVDAELLSASRAREEQLSQQLKTLTEELLEAKKYHTPVGT